MMIALLLITAVARTYIGPSAAELFHVLRSQAHEKALMTRSIRSLKCAPFEEEPTELHCSFLAMQHGRWIKRTAIVTYDKVWTLLALDE